jgi:dTDP-L-rhamnose 4-epimerase
VPHGGPCLWHPHGGAALLNVCGPRQALSNPYTGVAAIAIFSSRTILDVAQALGRHLEGSPPPEIAQTYRAGDLRHCVADISRLQNQGYRPQVQFEEGMGELVEWVKSQTAADTFERARQELVERGLAR